MEIRKERLSNKSFEFCWEDPMHSTDVKIDIPNLEDLRFTVWGDWGPMYNFYLSEVKAINISYNGKALTSSQRQLSVESPMLAKERARFPFYLIVEDKQRNLKFYLYVNSQYELGKVEVLRFTDKVKLFDHQIIPYNYSRAM